MDLQLSGKNAIITGASKGIGKSIALILAEEGANVAICARGEESLRSAEKELAQKGVNVFARICDVGDESSLDAFFESAKEHFGTIDILVNNVSAFGLGEKFSDWETSVKIDILATVRATQKVIPWMEDSGSGSILFISSISGLESGSPSAYAASKAALISYSKTLSAQLAMKKIRVNTIAPGSIEFSGGLWEMAKNHDRPFYDKVLSSIPSGRMGSPEEVGKVAAFLVSPCASWVTGACVSVDGGQHRFNL